MVGDKARDVAEQVSSSQVSEDIGHHIAELGCLVQRGVIGMDRWLSIWEMG